MLFEFMPGDIVNFAKVSVFEQQTFEVFRVLYNSGVGEEFVQFDEGGHLNFVWVSQINHAI